MFIQQIFIKPFYVPGTDKDSMVSNKDKDSDLLRFIITKCTRLQAQTGGITEAGAQEESFEERVFKLSM